MSAVVWGWWATSHASLVASEKERDWARLVRCAAYAAFTAAGPFAVLFPPPSMVETIGPGWAGVWGVFIAVGGFGCLLGSLTGLWPFEYVFLFLLGAACAVYATIVFQTVTDTEPGRAAGGAILTAVTLLLADRWFDVRAVARSAHNQAISHGATHRTTKE